MNPIPIKDPSRRVSPIELVSELLASRVSNLAEADRVTTAFGAWFRVSSMDSSFQISAIAADVAQITTIQQYQDVAVLGYALALHPQDAPAHSRFKEGVAWMQGRRFFVPNQPLGFEADALAIFGISLGLLSIKRNDSASIDESISWLTALVEESVSRFEVSNSTSTAKEWDISIIVASIALLNSNTDDAKWKEIVSPDFCAALAAQGLWTLNDDDEQVALQTILDLERTPNLGVDRAIAQAVALRWLVRQGATALPARANIADVVTILSSVPHALKRWPWEDKPKTSRPGVTKQRWDVQNEYHVQSIAWALMAPIFPDLEDEEYLRSLGYKHPRVDLAIPSLRLIIELKFIRDATPSGLAKITEEIAADASMYLSQPSDYAGIVAFLWDDTRSTERHVELRAGLKKLPGIVDVVIVSRPGSWEQRA